MSDPSDPRPSSAASEDDNAAPTTAGPTVEQDGLDEPEGGVTAETGEVVEPGSGEAIPAEPPAPEPDPEPASLADADAATEPVVEPVIEATPPEAAPTAADAPVEEPPAPTGGGASSGELEWQPVVTGDQISWQPVVAAEADDSWPTADELVSEWEEQPAASGSPKEEEWGAGAPEPAGNGAADRRTTASARRSAARRAGPTRRAGGPRRPPAQAGRPPDPRAKNRRMVVLLSILSGVIVLVAVLGYALSNGITSKVSTGANGQAGPPTTTATAPTLPASEFQTFQDDLTGLSIRFPKTWQRVGTPVADVRLEADGGGNEGLRIRVLPIETPATVDNIANYKAVTDGIAFSDPNNKLVKEQLIRLNGRLAYYYLYTYQDSPTGLQGVHAHYFIFEGHRMFTMVLQAVPADDFRRLAGVYDQIAESFTVPEERTLPSSSTSVP